MPYACANRYRTDAMMSAQEMAPIPSITCCREGVAPSRYPHFISCRLLPAMHAAQHTTAPSMMLATGPIAALVFSASSTNAANRIVAIVIPETGLLEEPTRPAMYAETEQNKKPAMIMMIVMGIVIATSCT